MPRDQALALRDLADELMRRRRVKGERITEKTFIRVASDRLLAHRARLRGSGEDGLRLSVTSTPARPVAARTQLDYEERS